MNIISKKMRERVIDRSVAESIYIEGLCFEYANKIE